MERILRSGIRLRVCSSPQARSSDPNGSGFLGSGVAGRAGPDDGKIILHTSCSSLGCDKGSSPGFLKVRYDGLKKSSGRSAVDGLMINRQTQGKIIGISHLAGFQRLGLSTIPPTPRMAISGAFNTGVKVSTPSIPKLVRVKEPPAQIIRRYRSLPAINGHFLDGGGQFSMERSEASRTTGTKRSLGVSTATPK